MGGERLLTSRRGEEIHMDRGHEGRLQATCDSCDRRMETTDVVQDRPTRRLHHEIVMDPGA